MSASVPIVKHLQDWCRESLRDLWSPPKGNIPALDVLRALAIMMVFCGHFAVDFQATGAVDRFPLFYWSWAGVDLFFVLSGALIGAQLWKELQRTESLNIGRFLLRRGLRIWPLYFSFVAFGAAEVWLNVPGHGRVWPDVFCVSNYFQNNQVSGGWSLSTEEQFYILAPVALWGLSRILKLRTLWVAGASAMLVCILSRAFTISHSILNEQDLRQQLYFPIHTHADGLGMGVLIAWWWVFLPHRVAWFRWRGIVAGSMIIGGALLYALDRLLFNYTSLALIFGAVTLLGAALRRTPRLLRWRGFYPISRLSYGIYLNHFVLLKWLAKPLLPWRVAGGNTAFFLLLIPSFLVCMLFATFTFQLIEWPFLRLRSRWLRTSRTARDSESSNVGAVA